MAPQPGFEPGTNRLTVDGSTAELLWNKVTSGWESNPISDSLVGVSLPIDYAEEMGSVRGLPAGVIKSLTHESPMGFSWRLPS